jgi:hypothetical protein
MKVDPLMLEGMVVELCVAIGAVAAGGVVVCAKAGAAKTVARAAAVKVRFIMEKSSSVRDLENRKTDARRIKRCIKKNAGPAPRVPNMTKV